MNSSLPIKTFAVVVLHVPVQGSFGYLAGLHIQAKRGSIGELQLESAVVALLKLPAALLRCRYGLALYRPHSR
jgi:hypothetical protein